MTEFVIKLRDESKTSLLLSVLKQMVMSQGVDLSVEQNGHGIALDALLDDDLRFEATINQIIADAIAGKAEPLTEKEEQENDEYWERVGAELNLTDDDIVRLVNQVRAERRVQNST